jgi:hypothetical protein
MNGRFDPLLVDAPAWRNAVCAPARAYRTADAGVLLALNRDGCPRHYRPPPARHDPGGGRRGDLPTAAGPQT